MTKLILQGSEGESEEEDHGNLNVVQLKSRFGQLYQCSFPNAVEQEKQKEEAEKEALEVGIPDLLRPMEAAPCLRKVCTLYTYTVIQCRF